MSVCGLAWCVQLGRVPAATSPASQVGRHRCVARAHCCSVCRTSRRKMVSGFGMRTCKCGGPLASFSSAPVSASRALLKTLRGLACGICHSRCGCCSSTVSSPLTPVLSVHLGGREHDSFFATRNCRTYVGSGAPGSMASARSRVWKTNCCQDVVPLAKCGPASLPNTQRSSVMPSCSGSWTALGRTCWGPAQPARVHDMGMGMSFVGRDGRLHATWRPYCRCIRVQLGTSP